MSCLDLVSLGYDVHLLADGVSSVNKEEIPYALDRMRQAGVIVSTSESVAFQLQGTSSGIAIPSFGDSFIASIGQSTPLSPTSSSSPRPSRKRKRGQEKCCRHCYRLRAACEDFQEEHGQESLPQAVVR